MKSGDFKEGNRQNSKPFKYVDRPKSTNRRQRCDWINYFEDCWWMLEHIRQYIELIRPKRSYYL